MGFKVDFSELKKFEMQMKITSQDFNNFLRKFLLEMALRIIRLTKKKQAGKVNPIYTAFDTGYMTSQWDISQVFGEGRYIFVEFTNNAEYATEIEYGHRIVRGNIEVGYYNGRFMLKTSIDEIDKEMPARYQEKFHKFCKQRGLDAD